MMKRKVLSMKIWLLILGIVARYHASVFCPETKTCEEGSNVSVECNITGSDKFEIYWYKGIIPASDPILEPRYEGFGSVEHHKGEYDMTSTGTLKISNVKKEHEGSYFILVTYARKPYEARKIEVKVLDAFIVCPEIGRFEEGSEVNIKCNITTGGDKFNLVLYKGKIPTTEPILELQNVTSGVVEDQKGAYGITSTGVLTIYNVKKEHADFYVILVVYENKPSVSQRIEVKVTTLPSPPYPHIGSCTAFRECRIKVTNGTNLTCKLNGIRPMMSIKWIIQKTENANITTIPQIAKHDIDTDTWNVSVTLLYTALSCNSAAFLQCKAEDDWKLLKYSVASVLLSIEEEGYCRKGYLKRIQERIRGLLYFLKLLLPASPVLLICTCWAVNAYLKKAKAKDLKTSTESKTNCRIDDEVFSSPYNKPLQFESTKPKNCGIDEYVSSSSPYNKPLQFESTKEKVIAQSSASKRYSKKRRNKAKDYKHK